MEAIILWFQPLLWIVGTITTLGLFIRFCAPVWRFVQTPKKLCDSISALEEKMIESFKPILERLDSYDQSLTELKKDNALNREVQQNLLRDRLLSGYHFYKERGSIPGEAYRALCEIHTVYKKNGGNSYADSIMKQIHKLYESSVKEGPP